MSNAVGMRAPTAFGFDGGGTHSEGVWVEASGTVLGFGRGGTTHGWYGQADLVEGSVLSVVDAVFAGRPERPDLAVCAGPTAPRAAAKLKELVAPAPMRHISEADCFLAAALRAHGLVILAGTGSFVAGRTSGGASLAAGGAGPVIGDTGSAFDLGIMAIRTACLAASLRGLRGPLTEAVLAHFGAEGRWGLVELYHRKPLSRREVASAAPLVTRAAEQGDPVARSILEQAASAVADIATHVVAELGLEGDATVVLAGGATASAAYRDALAERLAPLFRATPEFVVPRYRPAVGSALYGLKELGVPWDDALLRTLDTQLAARSLSARDKG